MWIAIFFGIAYTKNKQRILDDKIDCQYYLYSTKEMANKMILLNVYICGDYYSRSSNAIINSICGKVNLYMNKNWITKHQTSSETNYNKFLDSDDDLKWLTSPYNVSNVHNIKSISFVFDIPHKYTTIGGKYCIFKLKGYKFYFENEVPLQKVDTLPSYNKHIIMCNGVSLTL